MSCGEPLNSSRDASSFLVRCWQCMQRIEPQATRSSAASLFRTKVESGLRTAALDLAEQRSHRACGRGSLHSLRPVAHERIGEGINGNLRKRPSLIHQPVPCPGPHQNAGCQAQHVPRTGSERSFIEIVHVKAGNAIRPAKRAKILQVKIARDPAGMRGGKERPLPGASIEQMTRRSQECERRCAHRGVANRQAYRIAAGVVAADRRHNVDARPQPRSRDNLVTSRRAAQAIRSTSPCRRDR